MKQGFQTKILLRGHKKFELLSPLIETLEGSVRDFDTVKTLLNGCSAVISTLEAKLERRAYSYLARLLET